MKHKNNDTVINYEVDKAMYKAYQILTPLQKKSNSGFNEVTTIKTKSRKNWLKKFFKYIS